MVDFEVPVATAPGGAGGASPAYTSPSAYPQPGAGFAPPAGPAEEEPRSAPKQHTCRCHKKTSVRNIIIIVFYYVFRFGTIAYLLASALAGGFGLIVDYAVPLAFMVLDFWFTKNVAGRCMACLRWHSYTVDGRTYHHYEFELHPEDKVNKFDRMMFWLGLWLGPVFWVVDFLAFFFGMNLLVIPVPILGVYITVVVLTNYLRCSGTRKKALREEKMAQRQAASGGSPAGPSFAQQMATAATTMAVNAAVSNYT